MENRRVKKIRVMVTGLSGKIAESIADWISKMPDMILLPFTLSGEPGKLWIGQNEIWQIAPEYHRDRLRDISPDVVVDLSDFSHTKCKKRNCQLYCDCNIPFLVVNAIKDSGFLREVKKSGLSAFIVPQDEIQEILEAIRLLKARGSGSRVMTIRLKKRSSEMALR